MAFCFAGKPLKVLQLCSNIGPISGESRWYHEGILDHTRTHPVLSVYFPCTFRVLSCLGDAKDSAST